MRRPVLKIHFSSSPLLLSLLMSCSLLNQVLVQLYLFRYGKESKARNADVYFLPRQLVEEVHGGLIAVLATGCRAFEMSCSL